MTDVSTLKAHAELIKEFCSYMYETLGITQPPTIILKQDAENKKNPLGKTGFYDPDAKKIVVFISGRHIKDVLRSLGHEMVHHKQNCEGRFNNVTLEQGYAQTNTMMREMEGEAYLLGSFLVRDFEDNRRRIK